MYGLKRKRFKREVRRRRCQSASIKADGLMTHECRLNNLSLSGAELVVQIANVLPSQFEIGLVLTLLKRNVVRWSGVRAGQSALDLLPEGWAYGSPDERPLCCHHDTQPISVADQHPRFDCLIFNEVLVRMCASRTFKTAHVISGLRWLDPT